MTADSDIAQKCRGILLEMYDAARDENGGWSDVADALGNVVSPAMIWKIANGKGYSSKVACALGIPTQDRCKANGWVRRAAWIRESNMGKYKAWLKQNGWKNLTEAVDRLMEE